MDESRYSDIKSDLNSLGGKIDKLADIAARTDAKQDSLKEYITAVSANNKETRKELADHKEDLDAHGAGATQRASKSTVGWLMAGFAAIEMVVHFGEKLFKK